MKLHYERELARVEQLCREAAQPLDYPILVRVAYEPLATSRAGGARQRYILNVGQGVHSSAMCFEDIPHWLEGFLANPDRYIADVLSERHEALKDQRDADLYDAQRDEWDEGEPDERS